MVFKSIGVLDERRKNFLMAHVADSKELVDQFWSTPMRVVFDKQRLAHIALMISPMENKLHWVGTLRLTKKSSVQVIPIDLWLKASFERAEKMLMQFYQNVGIDDSKKPRFEMFERSYCYTKLLSDEEIELLPKSVVTEDVLESEVIM